MDVMPIISKLNELQAKIAKGAKIEAALWTLLESDKHENLLDEHKQLKDIAFELSSEITDISKSHFEAELEHMYSPENRTCFKKLRLILYELEELLIRQQKDLLNLDKLSHAEIMAILNGNKKGKDISETSQKITEISSGINAIIEDIRSNYHQEHLIRQPKETKVKKLVA